MASAAPGLPGRTIDAVGATAFALLFAVPTIGPAVSALADPAAWQELAGAAPQLARLAARTLALAAAVAGTAVPLGIVAAWALARLDIAGRRLATAALLVAGTLPLALYGGAWQACVGPYGFVNLSSPGMPSLGGFWPAWLLHAAFALPLATALAAFAFRSADPDAEDAARCDSGLWTVFRRVALPALRPALPALALLAATPVFADMSITDLFQFPTLAEEVYTEINHRGVGGERPAVLALLPLAGAAAWLLGRAMGRLLPVASRPAATRRWEPDRSCWPFAVACWGTIVLAAIPFAGLVRQLGFTGGTPETVRWSAANAGHYLKESLRRNGPALAEELLVDAALAAAAVAAAAPLAWRWRWSGPRGRRWGLAAAAWALLLPGPALAMGLLDLFQSSWIPEPLAALRSTPWPMRWAVAARALPWAFLILAAGWLRQDRAPHEAAWLDGAGPWRQFVALGLPAARAPLALAWLAAFVFSWQELAASKLLLAPGQDKLARRLFDLLHNGTANEQAALCLLAVGLGAILAGALARAARRWS